ncbi:interferon alpha/beta receptor 2 [Lissotriton helveticus]
MSTLKWLVSFGHLITLALAVFPAPSNVTLRSENFQHVLTWSPGNPSCTPSVYRVKYTDSLGDRKWHVPEHCSNTSSRSCDLTNELTDTWGSYLVQVQCLSSTGNDSQDSEAPVELRPRAQTLLGPPAVHISACKGCINITLQSPVSYLKSKDKSKMRSLIDEYNSLYYTITLQGPGLPKEIKRVAHEENFTTFVDNLLPHTNYCISVVTSATSNLSTLRKSSPLKCIVTDFSSSTTGSTVHAVILGVSLSIGVLLLLAGLFLSGFICLNNNPLPKALTKISKKENVCFKMLPEQVCPVEIQLIAKKKKVLECSIDEDESDGEDVHEDYACRPDINTLPIDTSTSDITTSQTFTGSSVVDMSSQETPCTEAGASEGLPSTAKDESGTSKLSTPLMSGECSFARLDNSNNFDINLASVSLGTSGKPSKDNLASQASSQDVQECSGSSQDSSAPLLAFDFLADNLGVQMAELSQALEDCFSNDALDTDVSDDAEEEENQVSEYMRH